MTNEQRPARIIPRGRALFGRRLVVAVLISVFGCAVSRAETPATETNADAPRPVSREFVKGPVRVTVAAERDRVPMGEPLTVRILIEAETGVGVVAPTFEDILGTFEVVESTTEDVDCDALHDCREIKLTLRGYLPGPAVIPPIEFGLIDPRPKMDGSTTVYKDVIQIEPIPIEVEMALADMKGPASLPLPWPVRLLWWALGAIGVVLVAALVARYWMRRDRRLPTARLVPQLPPYEWAMRELNRLIADDLVAKGQLQEFYYRINLLLRQYIERRFKLMAGEQTSEEFLRTMHSTGEFDGAQRETLSAFVAACDPVKYARQQPTNEDVDWVLTTARDFIDSTRPMKTQPTATKRPIPAEVSA